MAVITWWSPSLRIRSIWRASSASVRFVEDAAVGSYDDGICPYYRDGCVATRDGLGFLEG